MKPLTMIEDEWKWLSSRCDCAVSLNGADYPWQKLLRQALSEIKALQGVVAAADKLRATASCEGDARAFPGCCEECTAAVRYDHVRGRGPT